MGKPEFKSRDYGAILDLQSRVSTIENETIIPPIERIEAAESQLADIALNIKIKGADATGVNDSSTAIQNAINDVYALGGGVVYIPKGLYKCSNIVLKNGVHLIGENRDSAILNIIDTVNPAIKLQSFTKVKGIQFKYPNQVVTGAPTAYPATITTDSTAAVKYADLEDLRFYNSYIAVDLASSGQSAGKVSFKNIDGFPLYRGFVLDQVYDVDRLDNIHFNPNAGPTMDASLLDWVFNNGIFLDLKRIDAPQLSNIFCYGYLTALKISSSAYGDSNMVTINNFMFDVCKKPLDIQNHSLGIFLNNGIIVSDENYQGAGSNGEPCNIAGSPSLQTAYICFTNVSFRHFYTDIMRLSIHAMFTNCTFDDWNLKNTVMHPDGNAVTFSAATIRVGFVNCYFNGRLRANTRGITNIGVADCVLTVHGAHFAQMGDRDIFYDINSGIMKIANCITDKGIFYNGIPVTLIQNELCVDTVPVAGTWAVGDRFRKTTPVVGEPKAWVCTMAGTPGTWVSEGNL